MATQLMMSMTIEPRQEPKQLIKGRTMLYHKMLGLAVYVDSIRVERRGWDGYLYECILCEPKGTWGRNAMVRRKPKEWEQTGEEFDAERYPEVELD